MASNSVDEDISSKGSAATLTEAHGLLETRGNPDDTTSEHNDDYHKKKLKRSDMLDLSVTTIALFIIGKITGVGIIALPKALTDTGIWGIIFIFAYFVGSIYSGLMLARNWNMLVERDPRHGQEISRDPYPLMAYEAFGTKGRRLAAALLYSSIMIGVTADILLVSENFEIIFQQINVNLAFCYWLPIVTFLVCPLTWFGTPKDFWLIGITAGLTSVLSSILVIIGTSFDVNSHDSVDLLSVDFWPFLAALGLVSFAFSGQSVFPTLQHDMKKPENFKKSVVMGYIGVGLCYIPSSFLGFWVYGADLKQTGQDNVLDFFSSQPLVIMCILSLNIHMILSVVIDTNPLNQDLEEFLGLPYEFTWKRCLTRTIVMTGVLLLGFLVPKFSTFISIFGAPLTAVCNFILPSMVNLKLQFLLSADRGNSERWIPRTELALHIVVNTLAGLGGLASVTAGLYTATNSDNPAFTVPCFLNMSTAV